jgi:hypothetical protein
MEASDSFFAHSEIWYPLGHAGYVLEPVCKWRWIPTLVFYRTPVRSLSLIPPTSRCQTRVSETPENIGTLLTYWFCYLLCFPLPLHLQWSCPSHRWQDQVHIGSALPVFPVNCRGGKECGYESTDLNVHITNKLSPPLCCFCLNVPHSLHCRGQHWSQTQAMWRWIRITVNNSGANYSNYNVRIKLFEISWTSL